MSEVQARRTLVKSPPELWAELSDDGTLARHLEDFGEIRIVRREPETIVAWEGERASGTIEIAASGWGTRVTITAQAAPGEDAQPEPEPEPEPEPVAEAPAPGPPAPPPPEPTPQISTAEPELHARRGFFARLFPRREAEPAAETVPQPPVRPVAPVPDAPPAPVIEPPPPAPYEPLEPVEPLEPAQPLGPEPDDPLVPAAVLEAVLDDLGAAHHRPFSRA